MQYKKLFLSYGICSQSDYRVFQTAAHSAECLRTGYRTSQGPGHTPGREPELSYSTLRASFANCSHYNTGRDRA